MNGETLSPERIILTSDHDTVKLMQLVLEDAQAYYDLIAFDPDHLRQNGDDTAGKYPDVESVRRSIENPKPNKIRFGIWDGNTMVGSDNLTLKDGNKAELGSWVGKQYIGNGYAGRGRKLLVGFAFNRLGLDEVYCDIVTTNKESRRSVEKSGFQYVGEFIDEAGQRKWRYALRNPNKV